MAQAGESKASLSAGSLVGSGVLPAAAKFKLGVNKIEAEELRRRPVAFEPTIKVTLHLNIPGNANPTYGLSAITEKLRPFVQYVEKNETPARLNKIVFTIYHREWPRLVIEAFKQAFKDASINEIVENAAVAANRKREPSEQKRLFNHHFEVAPDFIVQLADGLTAALKMPVLKDSKDSDGVMGESEFLKYWNGEKNQKWILEATKPILLGGAGASSTAAAANFASLSFLFNAFRNLCKHPPKKTPTDVDVESKRRETSAAPVGTGEVAAAVQEPIKFKV